MTKMFKWIWWEAWLFHRITHCSIIQLLFSWIEPGTLRANLNWCYVTWILSKAGFYLILFVPRKTVCLAVLSALDHVRYRDIPLYKPPCHSVSVDRLQFLVVAVLSPGSEPCSGGTLFWPRFYTDAYSGHFK